MNYVAVFLEHVHLLNRLDGLHIEFFQRRLKLFVICSGRFMHFFHFSPRSAFTTGSGMLLAPGHRED